MALASNAIADVRWTADVPSRLKEIRVVRSELQRKIEGLAQQPSESDDHAQARNLRTLDNYYRQLEMTLLDLESTQASIRRLHELSDAKTQSPFLQAELPSFESLENARDALIDIHEQSQDLQTRKESVEKMLETSKKELRDKERSPRSKDKGNQTESIEVKLANVKTELRALELYSLEQKLEEFDLLEQQTKERIRDLRKESMTENDLESVKRRINSYMDEGKKALRRWEASDPAHTTIVEEPPSPAASKQLSTKAPEWFQTHVATLEEWLDLLPAAITLWKYRFQYETQENPSLEDLQQWSSETDTFVEQMEGFQSHLRGLLSKATSSPSQEIPLQDEKERPRTTEIQVIQERTELLKQSLWIQRAMERFQEDLDDTLETRQRALAWGPWSILGDLASYEITEVDDRSITLGHALVLFLLILFGIVLSYLVSRWIGRTLFPLLGIPKGVAVAWRSIFRYSLCILFGILAFRLLNIPLTAFAFLGGAVAIAIGFGSQDVMNNFMSGIILLMEQPIRVGDVVLLNDSQCSVTHIGLRSTRLKNSQNHELILPNTLLIEKAVTNLTLSDNLVRLMVPLVIDRTENLASSIQHMTTTLRGLDFLAQESDPIVILKEVDTYYFTFEIHFSIHFVDPLESLKYQGRVLEALAVHFPNTSENTSTDESDVSTASDGESSTDPKKWNRVQIEREIKKLQAVMLTKK